MAKGTRSPRLAADLSAEVKWYLKDRGYTLPRWCRPAVRTAEPRDFPGAVFDPERVDKVIGALHLLRHVKGKWRGRPLEPDPWQVAYLLAPVFGWVAPNDAGDVVRIIQEAYLEVGRKNGKTTMAGGLSVVLAFADDEPGAEVYAAAASKDQARNCFDPVKLVVENSPQARSAGIRPLRNRIVRDADLSFFAVASSVGDLLHGTNVHGAVVDELHVHRSPDVLDAIESGTGARQQPLIIVITTAGEAKVGTVYDNKRKYVEKLARGTVRNPRQYGCIFAASEEDQRGDRPFRESTWRKANPGYGISPTKEFMQREAAKARQSPVNLARFLRLHLGIRTRQQTRYIDLEVWDRNAGSLRTEKLKDRPCYGGLDLASTGDLTAFCLDFPAEDGTHDVLWWHWIPERGFERLQKATHGEAEVWRRQGWLTVTDGDVMDYDHARKTINAQRERFDVREIGYDRWNSSQLVNDLQADEATLVAVGQGYASMSGPTKELARLLARGTAKKPVYRHGGNSLMRWQVDNLAVTTDAAGNVKPAKDKSAEKIDGLVAGIIALSRAMTHKPARRSVYEDHGLAVVGE